MDDPSVVAVGALRIRTPTEDYEFLLTDEEGYGKHAELLQSALKEKLRLD